MISYNEFLENLKNVQFEIAEACEEVNRDPSTVLLLPVTKTQSFQVVSYVEQAGLKRVGENRVQEAVEKRKSVEGAIQWELIGHLQSNKLALAVEIFDRIQSIDSISLLLKLDKLLGVKGKIMPILLQINISEDPAKFGIKPENVDLLIEEALKLKNIRLEGLMTIPGLSDNIEDAKRAFNQLRLLRDRLNDKFKTPLPELSMGMSGDFVEAIKAGSTIIRVGSRLFGERK